MRKSYQGTESKSKGKFEVLGKRELAGGPGLERRIQSSQGSRREDAERIRQGNRG